MSEEDMNENLFAGISVSKEDPLSGSLGILERALAAAVVKEPVRLQVPSRPGVSIMFSADLSLEQLDRWRKPCKLKRDGFDNIKYACIILGNTSLGFYANDEEVLTADGKPMTLTGADIHRMLGVDAILDRTSRNIEAVKKLYGYDGYVVAAMAAVIENAGFDPDTYDMSTDDAATDPTQDS